MAIGSKVSSKEKRIADIAVMLASGLERKEILRKLAKTCKVSPRTIDDEIKSAKELVSKRNKIAEDIRLAANMDLTEEAIRAGLKSDLELEVILCQIASGNVEISDWVKGIAVLRGVTPAEQVNAIDKVFKLRGSNAPTKTDITTKGESISPTIIKWGGKEILV